MRIALVTCQEVPKLYKYEQALVPHLQSLSYTVYTPIWDDFAIDWQQFDLVVIRNTWDYHTKLPKFLAWLQQLEKENIRVINPIEVLRRNAHKFYLRDLEQSGIPIVPTQFIDRGHSASVEKLFQAFQCNRIVMKPAASAGAYLTSQWERSHIAEAQEALDSLLHTHDALVQPFQSVIQEKGEWSLVFYYHRFSHAVIKRTKPGDFRVQEEHGGTYQLLEAPTTLVSSALEALASFSAKPLPYARVDGLIAEGTFLVMELELIEPELFLMEKQLLPAFGEMIAQSVV